MQRTEDSSSRLVPEPKSTRPALSPRLAFLLLVLVIVILGAIVFLTRPDAPATPSEPTTAQQPDFSLTNEEAITRFEELNAMRVEMYESRDMSLAFEFLTPGSPLREVAETEIQQLLSDGVVVTLNFETTRIEVVENAQQRVVLRQTVIESPAFSDEDGSDLTKSRPQRRVVEWTLALDGSAWKLHDLEVIRAKDVKA